MKLPTFEYILKTPVQFIKPFCTESVSKFLDKAKQFIMVPTYNYINIIKSYSYKS